MTDRERLVTTLSKDLTNTTPAKCPRLPSVLIAALEPWGPYVVTIDPEKKLFPVSMEWIAVE
jgi:hypothetical protein